MWRGLRRAAPGESLQNWHLFANQDLLLNPVVGWTSDERCRGEQMVKAADETHECITLS